MVIINQEQGISEVEVASILEASLDHTDGPTRIKSVKCDWFKTKNSKNHYTNEYKNKTLVLRRGQTFDLEIVFDGVELSEIKKSSLVFSIDVNAEGMKNIPRKIQSKCSIVESIDKTKWCMEVIESKSSRLFLKVNIPANAIIGRYSVDVFIPSSKDSLKHSELIILFNPWSEDDEVYLDSKEQREEYVLNETGIMYQKNSYSGLYGIKEKRWNFGQFEVNILDYVLSLLERDQRCQRNPLKSLAKQSSALWISRILSAVVNSNDERGVLEGNWSGEYADGYSPSYWGGSVEILDKYYQEQQPVKYGQCWVFAGVLNTALRTLGIPARPITNFVSAHDTDQTLTIDEVYDEDGTLIKDFSEVNRIWNYHVWNEMWCSRKDLPGGKYDGWQVVDATPQERSFGLRQLGPAPVKAVKEGEIYAGFDTGFVFAEVNADCVTWTLLKDEDGLRIGRQPTGVDTRRVGKYISTKKVGSGDREDVTRNYKYPEGSVEERKSFSTAYSFGAGALQWTGHFNVEKLGKDVTIDIKGEPSPVIQNGKNFTGLIKVTNTSTQPMRVNITAVINSINNKSEVKHLIKQKKFENVAIHVGKSAHFELPVEALEYIRKLTDLNTMRLVVVVKVLETKKLYVETLDFQLENKDVEVEFDGELRVDHPAEVNVKFHNNLPIPLNNLVVTIEGAGLTRVQAQKHASLASDETLTKTFSITPYKDGDRTLIVDVDCSEVKDIKGFANVRVEDE